MISRCGVILLCTLGGLGALPGCGGEGVPVGEEQNRASPIVRTAQQGPVKMTVTVDKREITLSERFSFAVEVVAAGGVDVEMPRVGEGIGDLVVRDFREHPVEPFEGGWRRRQEYRLDAFLCGDYLIPELTARFTDRRAGENSAARAEVKVDEFTLTVRSQAEGELDTTAFRDIKGPVPLPENRSWSLGMAGGLVSVVVLTLGVLWTSRRRSRPAPKPVISPHQWALGRLQNLVDDQLIERGLVHEFYFRLSMIVRLYLERRFAVMAVERTTEEFIMETRESPKLPVEYHGMLGNFLGACDTVKYAQHLPHADKIKEALNTAREFVDQSAEKEPRRVTTT